MIHIAHASLYHWMQIGTSLEFARGQWQVSRVYAILNMGDDALLHGKASLDLCLQNDIKDFDLAFGYEAVAELALKAAEDIKDIGDKDYTLSEIKSI